MKLSDLNRARELEKERDYLKTLRASITLRSAPKLRLGDHDVKPDLVEKIVPAILIEINEALARNREDFAEIGVEVE